MQEKNYILLGDFNIDAFSSNGCAKHDDVLSNYRLLVKEPTCLDVVLLDHIYLHKLFQSKTVNAVFKNIFFTS